MELSLTTFGLIGISLFIILMFLQMPIGVSMLLSGFAGIWLIRGSTAALSSAAVVLYDTAVSYELLVIPLFLLMGILASAGGISKDAFSTMNKWVGHLPGGLAMATISTCSAFGAVSASHVATAAAMCSAALPEMRRYGYKDSFSLACISAGGNLGFLIPPSGAFIIYGFITQTPIGVLFISGIFPGLLLTLLFWLQIYIQCKLNPSLAPQAPAASWRERIRSIRGMTGIVCVFVLVMGGLYTGYFTTSESAAAGVAAVLVISLASRQLSLKRFLDSLSEAGVFTAMIMLLLLGSRLFGYFITTTEIPMTLAGIIGGLAINRYIILFFILLFYLLVGFFLDIFAILIVSLPIFFPIVVGTLGFDPLHFAVLSVFTIMIGAITPPFGLIVFAIHGMVPDVPLFNIFRGCIPFLVTMCIGLIILLMFPQISLALPDLAIPYR